MENGTIPLLRNLKDCLRTVRAEHDQAANRFRANQAFGDVLVGVGSLWVEETFDFPSSEARKAAGKLRARWKESPEYRQLQSRYDGLEDAVREALRASMKRPPSLRRAREATLLPTKLVRLEAIVDGALEGLERPASAKPSRKRTTRSPSRSSPSRPRERITLLDVIGATGSAASIVSLILYFFTQPPSLLVTSTLGLVALLLGVGVVLSLWRKRKRSGKRG